MRGDEKLKCHVRLESLPPAHLSGVARSRAPPHPTAGCYGEAAPSDRGLREDDFALAIVTVMRKLLLRPFERGTR